MYDRTPMNIVLPWMGLLRNLYHSSDVIKLRNFLLAGEYEKAGDYKKAIELNPRNASAYYNRGHVYGKNKDTTTKPSLILPRPQRLAQGLLTLTAIGGLFMLK